MNFPRIKTVFALFLCLTVSVHLKVLPNIVVCLGDDGHIELELAVDNQCGSDILPTASNGPSKVTETDDHCGDCSDIPIVSSASNLVSSLPETSLQNLDWELGIKSTRNLEQIKRSKNNTFPIYSPSPSKILTNLRSVRIIV